MFEKRRAQSPVLSKNRDQPLVAVVVMRAVPVKPADPPPDSLGLHCRVGDKNFSRDASDQPCDIPLRLETRVLHDRPDCVDQLVEP